MPYTHQEDKKFSDDAIELLQSIGPMKEEEEEDVQNPPEKKKKKEKKTFENAEQLRKHQEKIKNLKWNAAASFESKKPAFFDTELVYYKPEPKTKKKKKKRRLTSMAAIGKAAKKNKK